MGRIGKKLKAKRFKQALMGIAKNKEVEVLGKEHPGFRIFVLGAGFSVPAGLPTAAELYPEVVKRVERLHGKDNRFHWALKDYIDFRKRSDGVELSIDDIDLEEFMSFLDIEHFLGLEGGDTLSEHGNAAQLFVKRFIGQIIHERTPKEDALPQEYYDFAENLSVKDVVITLNYDVVLERALDHIGKPYRLFPHRYSKIGEGYNSVDDSREEVTILKLHGSLDWFSNKSYLHGLDAFEKQGVDGAPNDPIFNNNNKYGQHPLVDGPRNEDDPLLNIYRLKNIDRFYANFDPPAVPMILSPSHMKIVYANPFLDFWWGWGRAGGMNLGVSIIGFSLPLHDEYLRICLYRMISNFQGVSWDQPLLDWYKNNVKLVDYRTDKAGKNELLDRYRFIDFDKADIYMDGFSRDAVKFVFSQSR